MDTDHMTRGFNTGMNKLWDHHNRGVCLISIVETIGLLTSVQRQWKDIRHKYVEAAEEEEE